MIFPRCISIATILLLGHGGLLFAGPPASDTAQISNVTIGLDGKLKVGYWVPVRLTISAGSTSFSGHIEFTAPDGDDLLARFVPAAGQTIEVPPHEQWHGWRYVKLGRIRGTIRVALRDADGTIVSEQTVHDLVPHPATWQWAVTIGTDIGIEDAAVFLARMRDERVVSSVLTDVAEFPDHWFGYEGVNVLLVPTGSESLLERLNTQQFAALLRWLRLGGRMVLSAGQRAEELFAPEHRFHVFQPGTFVELDPFWKASGLENFARAAERVQADKQSPLAVFSTIRGRVLCLEGAGGTDDRALVTQYPFGFGDITYVALDLDQPPLAGWPARPRLLARLLQTQSDEDDSRRGDQRMGQMVHVGFNDLSGQLRAALDQFPGVTLVHFSWVAALLVAYILLMGPIDFFGLRRLGRLQWTWITFPLIVLLFCGIAVWLSSRLKGSSLEVNHVDIVDIDLTDHLVRGTTWASIYSADTTKLDIAVKPMPTWPGADVATRGATAAQHAGEVLLSWQGLPGTGLGGMNTTAAIDVLPAEYQVHYPLELPRDLDQPQIEGLPIHTASSKGIVARWSAATSLQADGKLAANAMDLLEGVVTNPLDVELTHCQVYYKNWAYPLERPLAPGDSARLGNSQPLDLRWRLIRRSVVGAEEIGTTWQHDNLGDINRILEILMFYGAAGGRTYTGLSHSYQGFVDLSRPLHGGRAILVGRCEQPASRLRLTRTAAADSKELGARDARRHWTYYRILIPVRTLEQSGPD